MKQIISILFTAILAACSGIKVSNVDSLPSADFSKYKTFGFYELKASGDTISAGFSERVGYLKEAITAEMNKRDFTVSTNPDLLINIGIVVKEEVQTRQTDWATDGRYTYVGQRNYKWESKEIEVGRYRNGTVTLHIVDAAKNAMLWKGSANGVVPEKQKNMPKVVTEAMKELFEKFPVAVK
jgi:hypothetical protein